MPKKKTNPDETPKEVVLTYDPSREHDADGMEEPGLVRYRVTTPRGVYIRVGPGRAYHEIGVLPCGGEVVGVDLAGMLRPGRKPGEAAWIKVLAQDGTGWVDSAFLERIP